MLKSVMLLNIFMKTLIYVMHCLQDLLTNTKFKRTEFIWNNNNNFLLIYYYFTVTFDKFNMFILIKYW